MQFESLNEKQQEFLRSLKQGSASIEYDIADALDRAKDIQEFKSLARGYLLNLILELTGISNSIDKLF